MCHHESDGARELTRRPSAAHLSHGTQVISLQHERESPSASLNESKDESKSRKETGIKC